MENLSTIEFLAILLLVSAVIAIGVMFAARAVMSGWMQQAAIRSAGSEEDIRSLRVSLEALEKSIGQSQELFLNTQTKSIQYMGERDEQLRSTLASEGRASREDWGKQMEFVKAGLVESLTSLGRRQSDSLETIGKNLEKLSLSNREEAEKLRAVVEQRLDKIRTDNSQQLTEMKNAVDKKLAESLEVRLDKAFSTIAERLERLHRDMGEINSLAGGISDLNRVLTDVRVRGTFGEVQLETLLEQFLSPEQFCKQSPITPNGRERVDFAVILPGTADGERVLLPMDAKFPLVKYEELLDEADGGTSDRVKVLSKELRVTLVEFAKSISKKYIKPPYTTDFAILFLPVEGLYSEVLRVPGLTEQLQREHKIVVAGPTTLGALLTSLRVGFRTLAIEQRSGEVWNLLGSVKRQFKLYGNEVDGLTTHLDRARKSVDKLGTRTRAVDRVLRDVDETPSGQLNGKGVQTKIEADLEADIEADIGDSPMLPVDEPIVDERTSDELSEYKSD